MHGKQYNAYQNFSDNNIEEIIIIYEELLRLISEAQADASKQEKNLDKSLKILVTLLSSTESGEKVEAKKALQSFYLLTIQNISKVLYCRQKDIYPRLIKDIESVKSVWEDFVN
ncbi:MAG: flagellar protein FliS [Rickettsiaceae bacterium H1]|nr:flagellar protein FliS [Rickettsiaceae bacterium H1]